MDLTQKVNPEEIGPRYIDVHKLLEGKNVKVPNLVVKILGKILHVDEINAGIYKHREKIGIDFANAVINEELHAHVEMVTPENIPSDGCPIIAANHPMGGPDGLALISAVGQYRKDLLFPVNDFLLYLPGLRPVFVPVDKVHKNTKNVNALENAFAGENALLYFPAGLCSRLQHGEVRDLEWKPTFIKKSVKYQRDIVPVYFDAQNRRRFYLLANLRKKIGIKFNFEMALLPGEMFAKRGKTFRLVVGRPIPYQTFDDRHSAKEWAQIVKEHVYKLKDNPSVEFVPHAENE